MKAEKIDIGFTKSKIAEYLLNAETVYCAIEPSDIISATQEIRDYRDYNDFLILSVSRRLQQPLLTYDESLRRTCGMFGLEPTR
ncbi:MAG: hypothetical protein QXI59_05890 [Candidatus Bathyarchaeia archaeon]